MAINLNKIHQKSCISAMCFGLASHISTGQSIPPFLEKSKEETSLVDRSTVSIGINSTQLYSKNHPFNIKKINIIEEEITAKSKIEYLKSFLGFNISQLSVILHVQRPTIYEWLENESPNISNQKRLDTIYFLFKDWGEKDLKIGTHLYTKVNAKKTLYDLLVQKNIKKLHIKNHLLQIKNQLIQRKKAQEKRDKIFKEANFKPITKDQKKRTINKLLRRV